MGIADSRCLFAISRCLPSECDVWCSLLQEKRILTLKKKWRRRFGTRSRLTSNLWQWLVSIYLSSTFEGNIFTKNTGLTVLPRAFTWLGLRFVSKFRTLGRLEKLRRTYSRRCLKKQEGRIISLWLFWDNLKVTFLCQIVLVLVHLACVWQSTVNFYTPPVLFFTQFALFLINLYSSYSQGVK